MNSSKNISKKEMNKKSSTMRLIAYMKPYAHWVIFALLLVLGLTAFDLYRPMLVGDAIDTFGANGDYDVIIATAIKYAVVLALSFAFNIAQTWILQKTGQNIILQMRKDLYRHIQSLGSRYFDITPVGKLVTRVTNDVEALNEMYSGILVQLFRNIVKIVGLAGVMLVLDVRLAAISFVLTAACNWSYSAVPENCQKYLQAIPYAPDGHQYIFVRASFGDENYTDIWQAGAQV